jgi:hypothetical protein
MESVQRPARDERALEHAEDIMSKANLHDRVARTTLVKRMEKVKSDSARQWGKMSVDQMVWHVNETLRMATGERIVPSKGFGPLKRALFKLVAFNMPWPKGKAVTAPDLVAKDNYDLDVELRRFQMLVEYVANKDITGEWPVHPTFGALTGPEWSRIQYLHIDHHLRQFNV